jgi:hypothetical protein
MLQLTVQFIPGRFKHDIQNFLAIFRAMGVRQYPVNFRLQAF